MSQQDIILLLPQIRPKRENAQGKQKSFEMQKRRIIFSCFFFLGCFSLLDTENFSRFLFSTLFPLNRFMMIICKTTKMGKADSSRLFFFFFFEFVYVPNNNNNQPHHVVMIYNNKEKNKFSLSKRPKRKKVQRVAHIVPHVAVVVIFFFGLRKDIVIFLERKKKKIFGCRSSTRRLHTHTDIHRQIELGNLGKE